MIPHLRALRKYEPGGLGCDCTLNNCQNILKSANLLHKQGFVDSQMKTTVGMHQLKVFFKLIQKIKIISVYM